MSFVILSRVDQADAEYYGFSADPDDPVTGVRRIGLQLPQERTAWENALPDSLFDL